MLLPGGIAADIQIHDRQADEHRLAPLATHHIAELSVVLPGELHQHHRMPALTAVFHIPPSARRSLSLGCLNKLAPLYKMASYKTSTLMHK